MCHFKPLTFWLLGMEAIGSAKKTTQSCLGTGRNSAGSREAARLPMRGWEEGGIQPLKGTVSRVYR